MLGHSNCGAVTYAINEGAKYYSSITEKIQHSIEACECTRESILSDPFMLDNVIKANTNNSITEILINSEYLNNEVKTRNISIVSGFYDTKTGLVDFIEF